MKQIITDEVKAKMSETNYNETFKKWSTTTEGELINKKGADECSEKLWA